MKFAIAFAIVLGSSFAAADINETENNRTHNVDCTKHKSVNLVGNKAKVTLNGTCDLLQISGNAATVTGSVKSVRVSGNDSKLTLDAVDSIMVSGNDNTISYKKTVAAKATSVLDSGDRNKVGATK